MVVALFTGGCKVDVSVGIDVASGGGGEVRATARLDRAAVAHLGGETPEKRLAVADLTEAGWKVSGPTVLPDGGIEVEARQRFTDAAGAARLVRDLAGEEGAFRDFDLRQQRTFLKTVTSFRSAVDLTPGLGAFTDERLREALAGAEGAALGVTDEQLEARFGAPVERLFGLQVAVDLPATAETNAPTESGGAAVWAPELGARTVLEATSERWNVRNILATAVALAATVLLVVVLVVRRRRFTLLVVGAGDGATEAVPQDGAADDG